MKYYLISTIVFLTNCQALQPSLSKMDSHFYDEAQLAFDQNDFTTSDRILQSLTEKYPAHEPSQLLAMKSARQGQEVNCLALGARNVRAFTNSVAIKEEYGFCALSKGNNALATRLFEMALEQNERSWRALNGLGIIHALGMDWQGATNYLEKARIASNERPSILINLALIYAAENNAEASVTMIKKANLPVTPNMALIYALIGHTEKARDILQLYNSAEHVESELNHYTKLRQSDTDLAKYFATLLR